MNIQWYPGHMTKTRRQMAEYIKQVDAVCEVVDARIPQVSRNPDMDQIAAGKPRLMVLNRIDLADPAMTAAWAKHFRAQGMAVIETDSRAGTGTQAFAGAVRLLLADKIAAWNEKGLVGKAVRVMVVGIPNVGKSTFINSFAGKACAKTGNKPGVTKGNQWIRLNKSLELLDTPGILWPKFEDQTVGIRLALIGSINDEILNKDELALELIRFLQKQYPNVLEDKYQADASDAVELLNQIAKARACLSKGGELDLAKASRLLIDDFRNGKLGKITLELPPECPSGNTNVEQTCDEKVK